MSSVPPLLTPSLPPAAPAAPVAAEVVVVQAAAQIAAKLAAAKALEAVVVSQQRDGAALLKTELGMLQVKLPVTVTDGAKLLLQVANAALPAAGAPSGADGAFPSLRLTSVDGRALTAAMLASRSAPAMSAMSAAVDVLSSAAGEPNLVATMVKPTVPPPAGSQGVPAGTVFPVRVLSMVVAGEPALPTGSAAAGAPGAGGMASSIPGAPPMAGGPASPGLGGSLSPSVPSGSAPTSAPVSAPTPASTSPLPAFSAPTPSPVMAPSPSPSPSAAVAGGGSVMLAQEVTVEPPTAATPASASLGSPAVPSPPTLPSALSGVVAPNTLAGQPLVQTDLGLIALQGGPALPAGARVELQVTGPAARPDAVGTQSHPPPAAGEPWSGLAQSLSVLGEADPAVAARFGGGLPELGPRLAHGMAAFVAAAQNGVLRPVYGDRMAQALDKVGRGEAGRRMLQELDAAAPQSCHDAGGEWRAMTMPLLNGAVVEPVRLYVRRNGGDDGDGGRSDGGDQGQRFVVDVSLSALGRVQVDGLVRRSLKRFDVLVRTAVPLSAQMRQDISRLFADSCSAAGMSGEAGFQVTQRFVDPVLDLRSRPPGMLA